MNLMRRLTALEAASEPRLARAGSPETVVVQLSQLDEKL